MECDRSHGRKVLAELNRGFDSLECMPVMYFTVYVNLCSIFVFVFSFVILTRVYGYFAIILIMMKLFEEKEYGFFTS